VRVLCVPSRYVVPVASPTVLESFAAGTPVVGSTGISRDLLSPGVNGYRCDPGNEVEIAASIEALLDMMSSGDLTRCGHSRLHASLTQPRSRGLI